MVDQRRSDDMVEHVCDGCGQMLSDVGMVVIRWRRNLKKRHEFHWLCPECKWEARSIIDRHDVPCRITEIDIGVVRGHEKVVISGRLRLGVPSYRLDHNMLKTWGAAK